MNNEDKIFNKQTLLYKRKDLRNHGTSAEASLWNLIKGKKLEGRKFRRQQSIGNFIVDFCCPSEKLIIELDGDHHGDYIQIEKDRSRDKYLEDLGFKVIRFENKLVFTDPEYVIQKIKELFRK